MARIKGITKKLNQISKKYNYNVKNIYKYIYKRNLVNHHPYNAARNALKQVNKLAESYRFTRNLYTKSIPELRALNTKEFEKLTGLQGPERTKQLKRVARVKLAVKRTAYKQTIRPDIKERLEAEISSLKENIQRGTISARFVNDSFYYNKTTGMSSTEYMKINNGNIDWANIQPLAQGSQYGFIDVKNNIVVSPVDSSFEEMIEEWRIENILNKIKK